MPVPLLCLDHELLHFAERFRSQFSKPQYQYFVTVLLGLMECEGRRTLSALLREVGASPSLSGLSRFLAEAPWSADEIVTSWQRHFRTEMQPLITAEREQQCQQQPKRRGRPKQPLVTGYVIGDDSTMSKREQSARWKDWASTTRPPLTNASWDTAWCKDSMCCWIARALWLRSCTAKPRYVKSKRCHSTARSS